MTQAAATLGPLLGIYVDLDGTLFVQMAIFLLMVGFVHVVLVRPFLDVVEEREEGIGGSRDEADEMQAEADHLENEYDEKMRKARREAQEVRQSLRDQGLQEQKEMVDDVRDELQEKIESERTSIQQKVEEARSELESRAEDLASTMVEKIVPGT